MLGQERGSGAPGLVSLPLLCPWHCEEAGGVAALEAGALVRVQPTLVHGQPVSWLGFRRSRAREEDSGCTLLLWETVWEPAWERGSEAGKEAASQGRVSTQGAVEVTTLGHGILRTP